MENTPSGNLVKHFLCPLAIGHGLCIMQSMNLKEYIATLGDAAAAKRLGISERSAKAYRLGARYPGREKAQRMVKRSKGVLSLDAIYGA